MSAKTILIPAAVLAGGGALFVRMAGPDAWAMLKMVAMCVPIVAAIAATIVHSHRKGVREWQTLVAETNAALRAFASRAHLDLVEPPQGDGRESPIDPFCQAQGTYRGIQMRVSVESIPTDRLFTVLVFVRMVLDRRQLKSLSDVVDQAYTHDHGVSVCLGRSPKFWAQTNLDRIPETDTARLQLALDRVCDLAGMNQVAAGPKTGR